MIRHSYVQTGKDRIKPFHYLVDGDSVVICTEDGTPMTDQVGAALQCDVQLGGPSAESLAKAMMRGALSKDGFNKPIEYPLQGVA